MLDFRKVDVVKQMVTVYYILTVCLQAFFYYLSFIYNLHYKVICI